MTGDRAKGRTIGAVAVALLLLAACGDDGDAPAVDGADTSAPDGDVAEAEEGDGGAADGPVDATPEGEPIATTSATLSQGHSGDGRVSIRVDVLSLERTGDLVDLTLELTNEDDDEGFSALSTQEWGSDSFRLVDQENQLVYLTAVDSEDSCLCNTFWNQVGLGAGESVQLYARFGGVPEDVGTVDVQSLYFPPMAGVTISG